MHTTCKGADSISRDRKMLNLRDEFRYDNKIAVWRVGYKGRVVNPTVDFRILYCYGHRRGGGKRKGFLFIIAAHWSCNPQHVAYSILI
jgi:hypothetical protein